MSKLIAIPLILAGGIGLYFSLPGLMDRGAVPLISCYWLAAPSVSYIVLGLFAALGIMRFPRKVMCLQPGDQTGGRRLLPRMLPEERRRNAGVVAWAVAVPALLLACDVAFLRRPAPAGGQAFVATAVLVCLVMIAGLALYARRLVTRRQIRAYLASEKIDLDVPFQFRVEVDAADLPARPDIQGRMVCFEHLLQHTGRFTQLVIRKHSEVILKIESQAAEPQSKLWWGLAHVVLDSIRYPPSGQWGMGMYPFYHWEVRIEVEENRAGTTVFPITVEKARQ